MGLFTKIREFFFGRKANIEFLDCEQFPFDTLGPKEAKKYFYKKDNILCPKNEVIKGHFASFPKPAYFYLDSLFKFSWCKYWRQLSDKGLNIVSSDHFILLSYDDDRRNEILLRFAEKAYDQIHAVLKGIIPITPERTLIIHVNSDDYYSLEDSFERPESDDGVSSGGMFVNGVIPYMIFHSEPGFNLPDITLAHELTHALLSHNDIPLWVNEALACHMEMRVTGESYYDWSLEKGLANIDYWDFETIQQFWVGDAFGINASQEFSYLLAQGLLNVIIKDHRENFIDFIKHAKRHNGGEVAAQKYLGVSLGDIAAKYLGTGPWQPSENYMALYFQ